MTQNICKHFEMLFVLFFGYEATALFVNNYTMNERLKCIRYFTLFTLMAHLLVCLFICLDTVFVRVFCSFFRFLFFRLPPPFTHTHTLFGLSLFWAALSFSWLRKYYNSAFPLFGNKKKCYWSMKRFLVAFTSRITIFNVENIVWSEQHNAQCHCSSQATV